MDIIRTAYYIYGPRGDEINFWCFICVTQRWSCYKTAVFYIY